MSSIDKTMRMEEKRGNKEGPRAMPLNRRIGMKKQ
jgi:hypothetical protein